MWFCISAHYWNTSPLFQCQVSSWELKLTFSPLFAEPCSFHVGTKLWLVLACPNWAQFRMPTVAYSCISVHVHATSCRDCTIGLLSCLLHHLSLHTWSVVQHPLIHAFDDVDTIVWCVDGSVRSLDWLPCVMCLTIQLDMARQCMAMDLSYSCAILVLVSQY